VYKAIIGINLFDRTPGHRLLTNSRRTNYHTQMPVDTEIQCIRAPRGTTLSCKGWQQEAAMRMLMNNLDEEVAERRRDLVVYGGTGGRRAIGIAITPSSSR
jgi:hypothetical protein